MRHYFLFVITPDPRINESHALSLSPALGSRGVGQATGVPVLVAPGRLGLRALARCA